MCPMRFLLVFFSAILAGYIALKTVRSSPEPGTMPFDDSPLTENISSKGKQEHSFIQILQNGFWGFVDMASGRYLWRNLREMKTQENVNKSS